MNMFGSFPPSPLVVSASKVYSGLGADIVMESLRSKPLNERYGLFSTVTSSGTMWSELNIWRKPSTTRGQSEHCGLRACAGRLSGGPNNVALLVRSRPERAIHHGFVDLDNPPVDR